MVQLYRSFKGAFKKIIGACCLLVTINQAAAQQAITTLSSPNASGTYVATQRIILDNGFSALGASGFKAYIAPSAIVNCNPLSATPSLDRNYIQTLTPRQPFTDATTLTAKSTCEVMQAIQYFDGLGRPIQTVQVKANPDATKDLIQPQAYDQFGREAVKYLPYTTGSGVAGSYRTDALTPGSGVFSFYNPTGTGTSGSQQSNGIVVIPTPSSSTVFEPSPLNRPLQQGAPGDAWQPATSRTTTGRTVVTDYQVNNNITWAADPANSFQVALYTATVNSDGTRTLSRASSNTATYDAGQLTVSIVKDENWTNGRTGTTETYTDKLGHIILKRIYNVVSGIVQLLSTYYVYDDLNKLAFVLPPGVNPDFNTNIDQTALNTWCYQYRYDLKQRLVEKRIPGKGWEYTVYNALDQAVAKQDANGQANGQWVVTKYDALGRVVITAIWNSSTTRITLQGSVDGQTTQWENRDNGQTYGYTLTNTYPSTLNQVLSVNYYDDYNITGLPGTYDKHPSFNADIKGLPTASQINVLGTTDMLWTVTYYDSNGRAVEIYKQHYLGGTANTANYDVITNTYDFSNAVTGTNRTHYTTSSGSSPALMIANTCVYDHMGRKLQSWEQINGGANTIISQEDYNEVGQLKTKHLHSINNGSTFLQDVSYAYNERGWLRTSGTNGNLFNMELKYNSATAPQYNGNIGQMNYLTTQVNNAGNRSFNYTYDALNRLTNAAFTGGQTGDALDEAVSYDVMGNITQLVRSGTGAGTLNYTSYTGNQLNTVTGYSARSYAYDANGNATSDGMGKGITYNLLNLPQIVSSGATTLATYNYDAGGDKLRNTGSDGTWDYISGIVYHNNSIAFVNTEEGRAALNSGVYNYEYNLKDHIGNNRVSIDQYSSTARVIQEDEYYSFGLRKPTGGYDLSNNNRYLYNGKEIQTDLANQYDYGARFYDPVIGRLNSIDPLGEKFYGLSPYSYVANNPILLDDPSGKDWSIRMDKDKDGTMHFHVTFTAAVLNETSGMSAEERYQQSKGFAAVLTQQFNSLFNISGAGFTVDGRAEISAITNEDQRSSTQSLLKIEDDGAADFKEMPKAVLANTKDGKEIDFKQSTIQDILDNKNRKTGVHEIGHLGGLKHPFDDYWSIITFGKQTFRTGPGPTAYLYGTTNFMNQGQGKENVLYLHPTGPSRDQLERILELYDNKQLNKESNRPIDQ